MSISTTYQTRIVVPQPQIQEHAGNIKGTPCMEIMQIALAKIAKERAGRVTEGYRDCQGTHHPCLFGLSTPGQRNGIGAMVEPDGQVTFRYDREGANLREVVGICDDIARAYATIAVMRIRNQHGYRVNVEKETATADGRRVSTMAVRY